MPRRDIAVVIGVALVAAACGVQISSTSTTTRPRPSTTKPSPTAPASSTSTVAPVGSVQPQDESPEDDLFLVEAQVLGVDDGDSLRVVIDGDEERVRLRGINAPEHDECLGQASRDSLERLVGEAAVLGLEADKRDQFGRILAHLFASDVYVNEAQVAAGLAIAVSDPNAFQTDLTAAEEQAELDGAGLWSAAACGGGSDFDGLEIALVESDPTGPDDENLDDEYVVVANRSDTAVDLGGFVLRDESTANRFAFDDGFVLEAGEEVTIVSGCRPPSGHLGWCAEGPIWNNGGDSALLLDPHGAIVDHLRY